VLGYLRGGGVPHVECVHDGERDVLQCFDGFVFRKVLVEDVLEVVWVIEDALTFCVFRSAAGNMYRALSTDPMP
jgi:hypothetical protein